MTNTPMKITNWRNYKICWNKVKQYPVFYFKCFDSTTKIDFMKEMFKIMELDVHSYDWVYPLSELNMHSIVEINHYATYLLDIPIVRVVIILLWVKPPRNIKHPKDLLISIRILCILSTKMSVGQYKVEHNAKINNKY